MTLIGTRAIAATAAAITIATLIAGCGSDHDAAADKYPSVVTSTQVQVEGSVAPAATTPAPSAGGGQTPTTCAKLPDPFTAIDACDQQAVAIAALTTMYSTNPTRDTSTQDAILRAVPLMSSAMIARIAAPTNTSQNADWAELKTEGKRVTARVTLRKEGQSTYYQVTRKAIPVDASNDSPGTTLSTTAISATLTTVEGMGYRLDSITPIT